MTASDVIGGLVFFLVFYGFGALFAGMGISIWEETGEWWDRVPYEKHSDVRIGLALVWPAMLVIALAWGFQKGTRGIVQAARTTVGVVLGREDEE